MPKQNEKPAHSTTTSKWINEGLPRLLRFNRLLENIYGYEIRFSEIFLDLGITQDQITRYRKDTTWLLSFMRRLEGDLRGLLLNVDTVKHNCILTEYYIADHSIEELAVNYRTTELEIQQVLDESLTYLQSTEGKLAFKKIISACIKETL